MQLEACLRSLKINFKEYHECDKVVIFKATDKEYIDGYKTLFCEYKEVKFTHETEFKINTIQSIDTSNKFTMFVMDDIVFKNDFSLHDKPFQIMTANGKENILAVSLRLHKGISYCYTRDENSKLPNFSIDIPNEACVWQFYNCDGDWGYGYALDANVYFTDYIFYLLNKIDFYNPNTLEAELNRPWAYHSDLKHPTYMACYPDKAKLINIPANRVQSVFMNRYEKSFSEKELNNFFLKNKRISLENITNIDTNSVHYPIDFKFIEI